MPASYTVPVELVTTFLQFRNRIFFSNLADLILRQTRSIFMMEFLSYVIQGGPVLAGWYNKLFTLAYWTQVKGSFLLRVSGSYVYQLITA